MAWLIATVLVCVRVAAATVLAPVFGPTQIPGTVRVLFAFALSAIIVATLPVLPLSIGSMPELALASFRELVIGASLSFGFLAAYAATQVAGRLLDVQIGFGVAAVINPATQNFSPLLGTLYGMVAVSVFLALDGHHVLIQAIALSVRQIPPSSAIYTPDWSALIAHSGVMFTFGLAFAAPVMFALLLSDLALGVLARSMPLMNVFVLSFTVKVVLGIVGLAVSIRFAEPLFEALFGATFRYWEHAAAPG